MKITRVTEAERGQEGEDSEAASNYSMQLRNFPLRTCRSSESLRLFQSYGSEKCVIGFGESIFSGGDMQQGSKRVLS